ncbi:MAG: AI-2E family transporter [Mucilaginibacter sp.]
MTIKKIDIPFYERFALVIIGIVGIGYLIDAGKEILDPLVFGFLFAILLLPIANFLEKKLRLPRSASSFLSIILLVAFIGCIVYLVSNQISNLSGDWPMLKKQIAESIENIKHWLQYAFNIDTDEQTEYVTNTTRKIMSSGGAVISTTFGAVSSLALFYLFIIVFTFFILFYRRLLYFFILSVFSKEHEVVVKDIILNIQNILRQYILGLLIEMVVVAGVACALFWIIGIKYAALLGLLVGLFNIIPYLGIFTALLLCVLITFATGSINNVVWVGISVISIHAIDANVLLPTIVGSKVRLNALITFLGIVLGEMIWGLSGMFLSIPVIAIAKIVMDRIEHLKPWGYLLGGDYEYKPSAEKKMKTE